MKMKIFCLFVMTYLVSFATYAEFDNSNEENMQKNFGCGCNKKKKPADPNNPSRR